MEKITIFYILHVSECIDRKYYLNSCRCFDKFKMVRHELKLIIIVLVRYVHNHKKSQRR